MGQFTKEQHDVLLRPIKPDRVSKTPQGMSHLEAYDVLAHLTRVFGFEGWDKEILSLEQVFEGSESKQKKGRDGKPYGDPYTAWTVAYRCTMRLTIRDPEGNVAKVTEDVGTGEAINQPSRGDAHDLAAKSAVSGALKRCAKDLGDQFGLGLYDSGSIEPCLKRVVIYPESEPPRSAINSVTLGTADANIPEGTPVQTRAFDDAPVLVDENQPQRALPVSEEINSEQRKKLYATARDKRMDPHGAVAEVLKRDVESINDLSREEASRVIDWLVKQTPVPATVVELKDA